MNPSFLAFAVDAFRSHSTLFVLRTPDGASREVDLSEVCDSTMPIVSYDIDIILAACRARPINPPANLIEIVQALKLRSGLSRQQGGELHWSMWRSLVSSPIPQKDLVILEGLNRGRVAWPQPGDLRNLLAALTRSMQFLWRVIVEDLEESGESKRFEDIEVPVQQLFHYRSYAGIGIDPALSQKVVEEIRHHKYRAFLSVARTLNVSPATLDYRNIRPFLSRTDAAHLAEIASDDRLEQRIKLAGSTSAFAKSFSDYVHARRALPTALQLVSTERIYPAFDCLGTVTGRILVSHPHLQQLRKSERQMVAADQGKRLTYLDYAQFEPGVLAFLSDDAQLLEAYNNSDIYLDLSRRVFGTEHHRAQGKRLFLAYSYGMELADLARLVAGPDALLAERHAYYISLSKYFEQFPRLTEYRNAMEQRFLVDRSVASLFGNRRVRRSSREALTAQERRWAVNHPVQATASLIFKSALLGLSERFGANSVILPMHDAVLLQFEIAEYGQASEVAKEIMEAAFRRWCPNIEPRVSQSEFSK